MIFMIDFENTNGGGLEGIDLLDENDKLIIFYSDSVENIKNKFLEKIFNCKATLKIRKLINIGANALDDYIMSEVGFLIGSGEKSPIAIVSKDKGYTYAKDYWSNVAETKINLILASNIEQAIRGAGSRDKRYQLVHDLNSTKSLTDEFKNFQKSKDLENEVKEKLTHCKSEYKTITTICKMSKSKRELYLNMLKTYGKEGVAIYNEVKAIDCKK